MCVCRCVGIPVRIHVSWLAAFALVALTLGGSYYPRLYPGWTAMLHWELALATSLFFFASVLAHEVAHCLVARRQALGVHEIVLFVFGGVSHIEQEPRTPAKEIALAFAGPGVSLALGAAAIAGWYLSLFRCEPAAAVLGYVAGLNLLLGVFNLIPAFPLDGGRVLRAFLWWRSKRLEWATRWASRVGRGVAFLFVGAGIAWAGSGDAIDGAWFAFMGWFLDRAAREGYRHLAIRTVLEQHTVRDAMVPVGTPAGRAAGWPVGLTAQPPTLAAGLRWLTSLVSERWRPRPAQEQSRPPGDAPATLPSEALLAALQQMSQRGVAQLAVIEDGQRIGLLTRQSILAFVQTQTQPTRTGTLPHALL